jgi:menaquinone-dependent protoporphyrinogen oxidase
MSRVLILYGTTDGHTRSVAEAIGRTLQLGGLTVNVVEAARANPAARDYGAVIVAASLQAGGYQAAVEQWVREHASDLAARPTAFVSVCLGILQKNDAAVMADLNAVVRRFCAKTGWQPGSVKFVPGALLYTRYNLLKRWIMKRIVAKAGGDTDTSRDYVYTDWNDVRAFAEDFRRRLAAAA